MPSAYLFEVANISSNYIPLMSSLELKVGLSSFQQFDELLATMWKHEIGFWNIITILEQ